jgi:hypothetical protein
MENIFKHNSRTYFDVYNALIAAYPNKPTWLFKEMGGLFDFQSELQNRIASDILFPITRESAYSFAAKCDYAPVETSGCTATETITLSSGKAKVLDAGYQVGGISTATGKMVLFETTAEVTTDIITLANSLKTVINAHAADAVQHSTAIDNVNYPIITADASNIATLIALVTVFLTSYDAHDADAEEVAPTYHAATETADHSLASAAAPTTFAECATRLTDLLAKYNAHDADATAHGVTSSHQESNSSVDGITISAAIEQKESFSSIDVGTIDNTDDYAEYPIFGFANIIATSITLEISGQPWTKVSNFDDSEATDRHFMLIYQSSGKIRIRFGDDTTGLKPAINNTIFANFETTSGLLGRLNASEITINIGGDNDISSVTNAADTSGGAASESVSAIIRNARANIRLRNIVWSQEDLEVAAVQASSSVVKALGVPGTGSATIHIMPSGGGSGAAFHAAVDTYVTALTQFGVMPIEVTDVTYETVAITGTATIRTGFTSATVLDLCEFALTLASCAYDIEVLEAYEDNGIDTCRISNINTLWSWAFTEDENDALEAIILKWIDLLGARESREWGQTLEVGDLWIMGNSLYDYGVDVFALATPAANTTATSSQIIDTASVAVT